VLVLRSHRSVSQSTKLVHTSLTQAGDFFLTAMGDLSPFHFFPGKIVLMHPSVNLLRLNERAQKDTTITVVENFTVHRFLEWLSPLEWVFVADALSFP
jgi:hypothetical protein